MKTFEEYKKACIKCDHCKSDDSCCDCWASFCLDGDEDIQCPQCNNPMSVCTDSDREYGMDSVESDMICTACGFNMKKDKNND